MYAGDKMKFLKIILCVSLVLCIVFSFCSCEKEKNKYTAYSFDYFDTATSIVGYERTKEEFNAVCDEIFALLEEYHKLYNIYYTYDGINNICTLNKAKSATAVDEKILDLLEYCKEMYTLTGGYTNVAMGSVLSIWHDYREAGASDPANAELPTMEKLLEAAKHTDINDLVIDREAGTAQLLDGEMSLDVGAVAKGYAVARVAEYLEEKGVIGYILNVGGNVCVLGARGDGSSWTVGIENPDKGDEDTPYIEYLYLTDGSLVTSGAYQRYYYVDGVRYHHIIDKDTLLPENKFLSVSVLCEDSGLGDALSTALFCMSLDEGKALVAGIESVESMWVLADGTQVYSSGWKE